MSEIDVRELALKILMEVFEKDAFLHIAIRRALDKYDYLKRSQKAFIKRICTGTVERQPQLDWVLDQFSKVPVKKQKPLIRTVLRMSLYQIMFMDSVPASAACNEAVELVKKHRFTSLSGFVNGVLRTSAREYKSLDMPEHIRLCMPEELFNLFKVQYPDQYEEILRAFLEHENKGTMIRINKSRLAEPEESYTSHIGAEPVCPEIGIYRLRKIDGIESVSGFSEGYFSVQDTAAALSAYLADPKPTEACIDLCAAPGGKTIQLLDLTGDLGFVVSRDIAEEKLYLIKNEVERCDFRNAKVEAQDATVSTDEDIQKYDIVLADVPCSGLGVIGSKPDIKYHVTEDGIKSLIGTQRQILINALKMAKPGGRVVYSTCTLNFAENEEQVRFILQQGGCKLVDISERVPTCFNEFYKDGMLKILPRPNINEGFFVAVLQVEDDE